MKAWTRFMDRVAVLPWPGIPNAYLCLSGPKRPGVVLYGDKWKQHETKDIGRELTRRGDDVYVDPRITFLYDAGNCCAEWDGEYGPIQLWWKCAADWKGEDGWGTARPHWFYEHAHGMGHWSQIAVTEAGLPQAFMDGDYETIFFELRRWADERN